ncbi:hypothetical protein R9X47_18275 [Wukongibacter baidiensis]|uniref:hypothetical protein n=1 Tax=Wukongibacter baidiensis TaxID=1723361 RepID=UPI003D7FA21A
MKIKSTSLGLMIAIILFGGILASSAFNLWKTESPKVPEKFDSGEFSGEYNPSDMRGSYTIDDVSSVFNIPLKDLKTAFGLSDEIDTSILKNKDLKKLYGDLEDGVEIGNGSMKFFVSLYTGLPYEMDEEAYLPKEAVEVLKANASLTKEQIEYLDNHAVNIKALDQETPTKIQTTDASSTGNQEISDDHNTDEKMVRGTTTFREVLDWGVSKDVIEKTIGGEIADLNMVIRDYCRNNEIQFSVVKEALQSSVDNLE